MASDSTTEIVLPNAISSPIPNAVPAVDLLADADCLKCGYALRGLTEYRCPECGTPFDPADFVDTFVPKWPKLLLWWAIGLLSQSVLLSPSIIAGIGETQTQAAAAGRTMPLSLKLYYARLVVEWLLSIGLSLLVVVGLRHRRDWARRATIAGLLGMGLLGSGGMVAILMLPDVQSANSWWLGPWYVQRLLSNVLGDLIPGLMLAIYLTTGLCRASLARDSLAAPPVLKTIQHSERSDWLLLLRLFLFVWAFECTACFVSQCCDLNMGYGFGGLAAIHLLALLVAIVGCLVAARRSWRNPARLRVHVCVAFGLFVCSGAIGVWWGVVAMGFGAAGPSWDRVAMEVLYNAGMLFPRLAIMLFVFMGIDRNDIERVARLPRKGAAPAGLTVLN